MGQLVEVLDPPFEARNLLTKTPDLVRQIVATRCVTH